MKNKRLVYIFGVVIGIAIISIFTVVFFFHKTNKEIQRFEEEFSLKLPKESKIIFSEDDHGALGDGTRLYIYQLSQKSMSEFIEQKGLNYLWHLPFNEKLSLGLLKKIKSVSSEKIASAMRFGSSNGYYNVKNRYGKPLKGFDFNDISYSNIIIVVIDLDNNKIFYYTLDM